LAIGANTSVAGLFADNMLSTTLKSNQRFPAVAVAPQAGQADYSVQWVEYYRGMGMTRKAEAIEQARVSFVESPLELLTAVRSSKVFG